MYPDLVLAAVRLALHQWYRTPPNLFEWCVGDLGSRYSTSPRQSPSLQVRKVAPRQLPTARSPTQQTKVGAASSTLESQPKTKPSLPTHQRRSSILTHPLLPPAPQLNPDARLSRAFLPVLPSSLLFLIHPSYFNSFEQLNS